MISSKIAEASGEGGPSTPVTILAAGTNGTKNRIYKFTLTSSKECQFAISDGFGTYNVVAGVPVVLDYSPFGKFQTTADTLISVTPSDVASVGALVQYETK